MKRPGRHRRNLRGARNVWRKPIRCCFLWITCILAAQTTASTRDTSAMHPAYCAADMDTVPSARLRWPQTPAGQVVTQPCPTGATGNVERLCQEDIEGPTGGSWGPPDVRRCLNDLLTPTLQQVASCVSMRSPDTETVMDKVDGLRQLTEEAMANNSFYPQELKGTADILREMSIRIHSYTDVHKHVIDITESFASTMGTVTSKKSLDVWNNFADEADMVNTALGLLTSAENFAINLMDVKNIDSSSAEPWSYLRVLSESIDFELSVIPELYNGSQRVELTCTNGTACIILPEEVANISSRNAEDGDIFGYYRGQFPTLTYIMARERVPSPTNPNSSLLLNSDIVTVSVVGVDEEHFEALKSPVILILPHTHEMEGSCGTCYSLNMSSESAEYRWTDEGCFVVDWNATHTTCHCYHLTSFALLMDIFEIKLEGSHKIALSYISYIGGSLSIIGCLLSIILYEFFRLGNERIRIHEMLAVAIVLSQFIFFVGFDRTENKYVCRACAVLLHFFLTAMFCWMLVEGIHLYLSLVKVFRRPSCLKKYCLLGWGIPVVNVAISVAVFVEEYGSDRSCWVTTRVLLISFVPFVAVTILTNLGILVMVLRVMVKSQKNSFKSRNEDIPAVRSGLKAIITLMPLLGLTWVFGFLSVDGERTLMFTYLFTIFNSLQGVFFFVFHCLLNVDVQLAFSRRYRRPSHGGVSTPRSPPAKERCMSACETQTARPTVDPTELDGARKRHSAYSVESAATNVTAVDDKDSPKESRSSVKIKECDSDSYSSTATSCKSSQENATADGYQFLKIPEFFEISYGGPVADTIESSHCQGHYSGGIFTGSDDIVQDGDVRDALETFDAVLAKVDWEENRQYVTHM